MWTIAAIESSGLLDIKKVRDSRSALFCISNYYLL